MVGICRKAIIVIIMMIISYTNDDEGHRYDDASYTNDDNRYRDDDRIVHK